MIDFAIQKLWKNLFSVKALKVFGAVVLILFVGCLYNNVIYADDSWFGEQAYWLAKCGYVKVATMKDFLGFDMRLYVYHRLNIFLGALIVKLFGFSVYYFKLLTLGLYILFFYVYYKFFEKNSTQFKKETFVLASAFIFINPMMLLLSFSYRPEIMVMLFGFLSYFQLDNFLKSNKKSSAIYSGVFAGLAFLSHPNGIIFSMAAILILIVNRRFKALVLFGIFAAAVSSIFFFDLYQPGHFATYLYQLHNWPDDVGSSYNGFSLKSVLIKLLNEHQRFFWSEHVMAFSVMFLSCLTFFLSTIYIQHKTLVQYLFLLIVLLNIFGSHIAERYLIYFYPYFAIIISSTVLYLMDEKKYYFKIFFSMVFVIQLFFSGKALAGIYHKNKNCVYIHHQQLNLIPDKAALTLVPNEYIFNELETSSLVVYKIFEYYQKEHGAFTQQTFFKRAHDLNIKYILIGERVLTNDDETFPFFTNHPIEKNQYYDVFYQEKDFVILKSKS